MADLDEDSREVPWHPRHAAMIFGHDRAKTQFLKAFESGTPHHAWLLCGQKGIGKATLAYSLAAHVLGNSQQSRHWIASRAHPDLFVLERQLNDSKPRKLKSEISVNDTRLLADFLNRTASGTWRVVIIDAADDLNTESANAILKLSEEPPSRTIILAISNQPSRLLATLRSRCLRLPLESLAEDVVRRVINGLDLVEIPSHEVISTAVQQARGSPGRALTLLHSSVARVFAAYIKTEQLSPSGLLAIAASLGGRGATTDEYAVFSGLMLDWVAERATALGSSLLADVYGKLSKDILIVEGFNLDRRQAAIAQLQLVNDALKAA